MAKADLDADYNLLDIFFQRLCKNIGGSLYPVEDSKGIDGAYQGDESPVRYNFRRFVFNWQGLLTTFIVAKHSERVSLTQVVDFSRAPAVDLKRSFSASELATAHHDALQHRLSSLRRHLESVAQAVSSTPNIRPHVSMENHDSLRALADYIFDDLWRICDDELKTPCQIEAGSLTGPHIALFSDFRGVLLPKELHQIDDPKPTDPLYGDATGEVIAKGREKEVLARFWELAERIERGAIGQELVACAVLNRSAIYASTMGRVNKFDASRRKPIRYLVIAATSNRRQLGRLTDIINNLGAFQLLALRSLRTLEDVSVEIQITSRLLDQIDVNSVDGEQSFPILPDLIGLLQSIGTTVQGGLQYRVNRSRFYAKAFTSLMRYLRIRRIEGFQPYDEFVQRRLYEQYDFIDRIGERTAQLRARFLTIVEATQSRSLHNINNELLAGDRERNRLMRAGQVVELVAVTYYGGILTGKIVEDISSALGHPKMLCWYQQWHALPYITVFILWAIFGHEIRELLFGAFRKLPFDKRK